MKYNILFCGMDEKTFLTLLQNKQVSCLATNLLPEFLTLKSWHPVEQLFAKTYRSLFSRKKQVMLWLLLLNCCYYIGSKLTKKYLAYLNALWQHNIMIIDFSDHAKTASFMKQHAIDLMVVNNWWLLPDEIIYAARFGTINIHPSKLPKYRGSVPTLWALKHHETMTAVSFMLLNNKMDDGDLLAQIDIPILETDDAITIEDKCNTVIADHLAHIMNQYLNGECHRVKQDNQHASKTARYHEYQVINARHETCIEIINKIKLYPYAWPLDYCYILIANHRIHIHHASIDVKFDPLAMQLFNKPTGYGIVKRLSLYLKTCDGMIHCRLFIDIPWKDSILLLRYIRAYNHALLHDPIFSTKE